MTEENRQKKEEPQKGDLFFKVALRVLVLLALVAFIVLLLAQARLILGVGDQMESVRDAMEETSGSLDTDYDSGGDIEIDIPAGE